MVEGRRESCSGDRVVGQSDGAGDLCGDEKLRSHLSSLEYFWHMNVHRWINKQKQQWQVIGEMSRILLAALLP